MRADIIPSNRGESLLASGLETETMILKTTGGVVESLSDFILQDFSYYCWN